MISAAPQERISDSQPYDGLSIPRFVNAVAVLLSEAPAITGVSVIVLTFNSARTIGPCVESVLATLRGDDELIVVDNNSADGTVRIVEAILAGSNKQTSLIHNQANLGFSAGCNVGIRCSRGPTVVLLNPDCIVRGEWLNSFEFRLEDPSVGAVGPVSDNVSAAQFVGQYLLPSDGHLLTTDQLARRVRQLHPGRSVETKLLIGFCIAFRRDVFAAVGLLDEDLFLGGEDLEMSLRLRSNDYRLVVAADIFVHHTSGASFKTLGEDTGTALLAESTRTLHEKLERLFAPGPEPSSMELFGSPILPPAGQEEIHVA